MKYSIGLASLLLTLALHGQAHAYSGFGPGLTLLGSLYSLIGGIVVALVMILLFPLRMLYYRVMTRKTKDSGDKSPPDA